jgi:hypothetical protein
MAEGGEPPSSDDSGQERVAVPTQGDSWTKLRADQGYRDAKGRIWKKDKKHKDHWDVSDKKGNKILGVDFHGVVIWPGRKNKNKSPK